MIITTRNSTYTLEDRGDGAFWLTSTNPSYTDMLVTLPYGKPTVGNVGWFLRKTGGKASTTFHTSLVTHVED